MISYLGYPIMLPGDVPFGTLCILDSRPNEYSGAVHDLILRFRDLIEHQLELLYTNQALGEQNRRLTDHLQELQVLRGLVSICAWCKTIKDDGGDWNAVEQYLARDSDTSWMAASGTGVLITTLHRRPTSGIGRSLRSGSATPYEPPSGEEYPLKPGRGMAERRPSRAPWRTPLRR